MDDVQVRRWVPSPPEHVWSRLGVEVWPGFAPRAIGDRGNAQGAGPPIQCEVLDLEPGQRAMFTWKEPFGDTTLEILLAPERGGTLVTIRQRGAPPSKRDGLRLRWERLLDPPAPDRRWLAAGVLLCVGLLVAVVLGVRTTAPRTTETAQAPAQPEVHTPPAPVTEPAARPPEARFVELARNADGHLVEPVWHGDVLVFRVACPGCSPTRRAVQAVDRRGVSVLVPSGLGSTPFTSPAPTARQGWVEARSDGRWDLAWTGPEGARRWLTDDPGVELHPRFRPDGRSVVYAGGVRGDQDLFEVRVDRGEPALLVGGEGDQSRPVPLPDGAVVYFERQSGERWDLGWAHGDERLVLGRDVQLPSTAGPAVSVDGSQVAWVRSGPRGDELVRHTLATGSQQARSLPTFGADELAFGPGGDLSFVASPPDAAGFRRLYLAPSD